MSVHKVNTSLHTLGIFSPLPVETCQMLTDLVVVNICIALKSLRIANSGLCERGFVVYFNERPT